MTRMQITVNKNDLKQMTQLTALKAKILSIEIEVEGMKAYNKQCEMNNESLGYNEHDFIDKAQEASHISDELLKSLQTSEEQHGNNT